MVEAASLTVVVLACLWLLDRREKRHQVTVERLLTAVHDERDAMAQRVHDERIQLENARAETSPDLAALIALVENLCQRVQAPREAVVQHQMESGPVFAPPAVLPDDDEGWFEARMPKEQLADLLTEQELEARGAH